MIHFLHVGKAGGTAVRAALAGHRNIALHGHRFRLCDVPAGDKVFFAIREPVARFVSGFNSRLRKGRPRRNIEWSKGEARAFEIFKSPDALAVALSDDALRESAEHAMRNITHLNMPLSHWFSTDDLQRRRDDVLFVMEQQKLDTDFRHLCRLLGLRNVRLPSDPVANHKTPEGYQTSLSEKGRANICQWYRDDIALYRECITLRSELLGRREFAQLSEADNFL